MKISHTGRCYAFIWSLCLALVLSQQSFPYMVQSQAPPPTFGVSVVIPGGLRGDIYKIREDTEALPDLRHKKPIGTIWTTRLDVSPRQFREGFAGVAKRFEWFAIRYSGQFWIQQPASYEFALLSDDGSKLYIDDQLFIDNDYIHPPQIRQGSVFLSAGIHRIRVVYFQGPRYCLALMMAVARQGEAWRIFDTNDFAPPPNPDNWTQDTRPVATIVSGDAGRALTIEAFLQLARDRDDKRAETSGCTE